MKVSQLWKAEHKSRIKRRALVIIPTLMLAVSLAFITLYSQNAGNFTLEVEKSARNHIQIGSNLSEGKLSDGTSLLRVPNQKRNEITYFRDVIARIPDMQKNQGVYQAENINFLNYTFYMTNPNALESVNIEYSIILEENLNDMASAIRILIVKDQSYKMYQKKEPTVIEDYPIFENSDFIENSDEIIREQLLDVKAGEIIKFTIAVWLEIADPDAHKPQMETGGVKFSMVFKTFDLTGS